MGLIFPSSQVQPRVPWVACRMPPLPTPRSRPPTHLFAHPVPCREGPAQRPTSLPEGQSPLVSATAQGGLKLLAVRPTLPPTVGKALGTLVHVDESQGTQTQPSGLLLPVVGLRWWRPGQGQPTWHGLRDFVLGASPLSCRTGSVSTSPRKPFPSPGSCWSSPQPKRTAHHLLHGPASHECGLNPPGFHWLMSGFPLPRQKRGDGGPTLPSCRESDMEKVEVKCGPQGPDCVKGGSTAPRGVGLRALGKAPKTPWRQRQLAQRRPKQRICRVVSGHLPAAPSPTPPTSSSLAHRRDGLGTGQAPGARHSTGRSLALLFQSWTHLSPTSSHAPATLSVPPEGSAQSPGLSAAAAPRISAAITSLTATETTKSQNPEQWDGARWALILVVTSSFVSLAVRGVRPGLLWHVGQGWNPGTSPDV